MITPTVKFHSVAIDSNLNIKDQIANLSKQRIPIHRTAKLKFIDANLLICLFIDWTINV